MAANSTRSTTWRSRVTGRPVRPSWRKVRAGDPSLRQELESLLQHGEASHAFFDTPAPELAADEEHRDTSLTNWDAAGCV